MNPGSTINQLLNNPPYGANGGVPGILGCDISSTNKTWLHCQLIRLDDLVRFQINGYPVLQAVVTNMPDCNAATNGPNLPMLAAAGSLLPSLDPVWIGSSGEEITTGDADHFVIFDNLELYDFSTNIAFTSMAIAGPNVFFNFFSQINSEYDPADFNLLITTDLTNRTPLGAAVTKVRINEGVAGAEGYYGGWYYNGVDLTRMIFGTEHAFFEVVGTNSP